MSCGRSWIALGSRRQRARGVKGPSGGITPRQTRPGRLLAEQGRLAFDRAGFRRAERPPGGRRFPHDSTAAPQPRPGVEPTEASKVLQDCWKIFLDRLAGIHIRRPSEGHWAGRRGRQPRCNADESAGNVGKSWIPVHKDLMKIHGYGRKENRCRSRDAPFFSRWRA